MFGRPVVQFVPRHVMGWVCSNGTSHKHRRYHTRNARRWARFATWPTPPRTGAPRRRRPTGRPCPGSPAAPVSAGNPDRANPGRRSCARRPAPVDHVGVDQHRHIGAHGRPRLALRPATDGMRRPVLAFRPDPTALSIEGRAMDQRFEALCSRPSISAPRTGRICRTGSTSHRRSTTAPVCSRSGRRSRPSSSGALAVTMRSINSKRTIDARRRSSSDRRARLKRLRRPARPATVRRGGLGQRVDPLTSGRTSADASPSSGTSSHAFFRDEPGRLQRLTLRGLGDLVLREDRRRLCGELVRAARAPPPHAVSSNPRPATDVLEISPRHAATSSSGPHR